METNFNIGSLKIVSSPLMEYFKKVQTNIADNIETLNEKKVPVNFESIDTLKKINGTLKMIGLTGVNKVLSVVIESLELVKSASFDTAKNYQVLEVNQSIVSNVVFYLQNLISGGADQPIKFFEQYSKLCTLIGKTHTVKDLFNPKLEINASVDTQLQNDLRVGLIVSGENKESLKEMLTDSHKKVQDSILQMFEIINKNDFQDASLKNRYHEMTKTVYSALDSVQKLKISKNVFLAINLQKLFVCISSPVFNDGFAALLRNDAQSVKINLGKVERMVKSLLDNISQMSEGEKTGSIKVDEEIVREVLFFIITVVNNKDNAKLASMPVFEELKAVFDINVYSEQLKDVNVQISVAQKNPEIANQIDKLFVEIKEELSLLTSKQGSNEEYALQHSTKFVTLITKFAELLNTVKSTELNNLVGTVSSVVNSVKNKKIVFTESIQKEVSLSLVLIEYGVSNFIRSIVNEATRKDFEKQSDVQKLRLNLALENKEEDLQRTAMPVLDSNSQKTDERKAFLVIFEKLHKDLKRTEEVLNDLFRDNDNTEDLEQIFKTLNSAKGIFAIINKNKLSLAVVAIIDVWKKVLASGFNSVNKEELSKSVSLLSGILLFVEASKNDNDNEANEMYNLILEKAGLSDDTHVSTVVIKTEIKEDTVIAEETLEVATEEVRPEVVLAPVELAPVIAVQLEVVKPAKAPALTKFVDTPEDPDLTEVYLLEAEEVLDNLSKSLKELSSNVENNAELANARRYFHTLKGSGRMVGLKFLGEVAWMAEQTFNKVISGDLVLNSGMMDAITKTKNQFDLWVKELTANNSVDVDLIKYKKLWLTQNSHLTNQVEINLEVEAAIEEENTISFEEESKEEVAEKEVEVIALTNKEFISIADGALELEESMMEDEDSSQEQVKNNQTESFELNQKSTTQDEVQYVSENIEKKDSISINGSDVSDSLYELFKEESEAHLKALRSATHVHENFDSGFEITKDFMRHAHTLASIAKSVNMEAFSEIVAKIEFITNMAIDKKIKLKESEFFVLKHAIDNLDVFANVIDGSLVGNIQYQNINNNLNELQDLLTNFVEEKKQEPHPDKKSANTDPAKFNIDELVAAISQNMRDIFEKNMYDLKVSVEKIQSEVKEISEKEPVPVESPQEINVDEMINSISKKVLSAVDEQYSKLAETLKAKENNHNETMSGLVEKLESLAKDFDGLNKNQQNIEVRQKENHEAIRKDLRYLNNAIKKKPGIISSNGMVQQEEVKEVSVVELILEDAKVETFENNEDNSQIELVSPSEDFIKDIERQEAEQLQKDSEEEQVNSEIVLDETSALSFVESGSENEVKLNMDNDDRLPSEIEEEEKLKKINSQLVQSKAGNAISSFLQENEFIRNIFDEKISTVEDEIDDEIFEISKAESDELLEKIEETLDSVQSDGFEMEQMQEFKRLLHTLKGSVRMAGANRIGAIAHRLESLLDYAETRGISLFKMKDLLVEEMSKISYLVKNPNELLTKEKNHWLDGTLEINAEYSKEVSVVEKSLTSEKEMVKAEKVVTPKREEKQYIKVGSGLLDGLINEAGEVRLTRTTLEGMLTSNRRSLTELRSSSIKIAKMLKEIEVQAEGQIQARQEIMDTEDKNFDPLEFDRFTRLQELTRFMNEAVADVQDTVGSMESFLKTQDGAVAQQSILTNNLLDTLMKVRLLPIDTISERLYKITRNTAKELNKKVVLELIGEKTEMDRLVLDKIISPLEHLLRNCIAHGVELPEDRIKNGKSPLGKVTITTSVDGNFIVLNIKDDGAGINASKVREIAIKKGLITKDAALTEQQIVELIFQSGFSTAETISQVSGRGVGMDVVRKEVYELGGSIDIKTIENKGTEFNVVLPVAVATNQAMLTKISGKLVAIPALIVEEVISLKKNKIEEAYQTKTVEFRDKKYPLYYLGHMLGLTQLNQLPEIKNYNTLIAVSYLGEIVVVHVDELETTNEILIKSIGKHFSKINGILGATLLGDGRQGIVINPVLLKSHFEQNIRDIQILSGVDGLKSEKMKGVLTVMVVDDSVTVRRATTKVLERYGYNIVLAKDGEDGLEQLQVVIPDIILSDIEMPRMDGFEFAKNVRNTEKYSHIPIVMITSRTADKHKSYAYSLGVNGFLGKPYQEEELIETIKNLTNLFNS